MQGKLSAAEVLSPDLESLHPLIEERVHDLRKALDGSPDERRAALLAVVRDGRFRVFADHERGFRVEGLLRVPLTEPARDREGRRAGLEVGSGGAIFR